MAIYCLNLNWRTIYKLPLMGWNMSTTHSVFPEMLVGENLIGFLFHLKTRISCVTILRFLTLLIRTERFLLRN